MGSGGTRRERELLAAELRAQGLKYREIAERLGVAVSTVDGYLNDPGGGRLRARKDSYRGSCERCGDPTDGSRGRQRNPKLCARCAADDFVARNVARGAEKRATVERLWAEGKTARQIAAVMGWRTRHFSAAISVLRTQRGYDLPHRRSAAYVAQAKLAGPARLAKARASRNGAGPAPPPQRT